MHLILLLQSGSQNDWENDFSVLFQSSFYSKHGQKDWNIVSQVSWISIIVFLIVYLSFYFSSWTLIVCVALLMHLILLLQSGSQNNWENDFLVLFQSSFYSNYYDNTYIHIDLDKTRAELDNLLIFCS